MTNQTLKKLIDDSSYCEFMGISTSYTGYGSDQVLNINLNDTKELTAEVSLQNNSVVSYRFIILQEPTLKPKRCEQISLQWMN